LTVYLILFIILPVFHNNTKKKEALLEEENLVSILEIIGYYMLLEKAFI
jgi:hypothetical protein